jgi:ferrous iron transport protein B
MDEAESRGYQIDVPKLSYLLGVPVVPMVANRNRGTQELLEEIIKIADGQVQTRELKVDYGREVEEEIAKLEKMISQDEELSRKYSPRWLAVKLLEGDAEVVKALRATKG